MLSNPEQIFLVYIIAGTFCQTFLKVIMTLQNIVSSFKCTQICSLNGLNRGIFTNANYLLFYVTDQEQPNNIQQDPDAGPEARKRPPPPSTSAVSLFAVKSLKKQKNERQQIRGERNVRFLRIR